MFKGLLLWAALVNVFTFQASAAYANAPTFVGLDDAPGDDDVQDLWMSQPGKKRKKTQEKGSVVEVLKQMWGTAKWPPSGKGPNPANDNLSPMTGMRFGFGLVAFVTCFWLGLMVGMRTAANDARSSKFPLHFQALVAAICWRHSHRRAVFMHLIRIAIPTIILLGLSRMQSWLIRQVGRDESEVLLETTGLSPKHVVDGIVAYFLTLAMVYVVMVSMLFFVWHVSAEKQSGFRHLLHVSGLSRSAYLLATAGVDGVMQAALGMLLMIFVSGTLLEVPLVLWTSPVLLYAAILLLAIAGTTMGYLICILCPSSRFSSMLAQFTLAWVIFSAPFAPATSVVPQAGQQSWSVLLLPVIPSYRVTFELVAACVKGRCLLMSDVMDTLQHGRWASPHAMFLGSNEVQSKGEMDPAESLVSLFFMALVQVSIGCILIALLDRRLYPSLNKSGVIAPENTNMDILLQAKGLLHSYGWLSGRGLPETFTLQGVSFEIKRGEMLGLLGPNGAGKTTAIRCITGEEAPTEGTVCISEVSSRAWIGLCPQETVINGDLTVKENLQFFANVRGATGDTANDFVQSILQATRLEQKQHALPDALSGGMRRRLAVGCAMIAKPSVVILDEPTTGLDPVSRRGIWETIAGVKQAGGCCLLTTHMLEEAEHLASYLVILRNGIVAAEGSVQALKHHWGQGYMLSVDSEESKETEAQSFITSLLDPEDQTPVKSQRDGQKTYKFSKDEEALGHLIISIARGKAKHGIRHWGVSQASLEDAYVRIIQQD